MRSDIISTTADSISSGGAITGDLTIEGDLTVDGGGGFAYSEVLTGDMIINQTANATALTIDAENVGTTGVDMVFGAMTSGYGVRIRSGSADAALTSGVLLDVYSKDSDTTARKLMRIVNDDGNASGTQCLHIQQDSTGPAIVMNAAVGDRSAAPTLAFGDGDSGFYESSDDNINISIAGTVQWQISSDKISGTETGAAYIVSAAGAAATPVYTFNDDPNTGMYRTGADAIGFSTGGTVRMILDDNSRISLSNNDDGTSNTIFGKTAGDPDGAGDKNVFIGELAGGAGIQTDAADDNTGVGWSALTVLTTGYENTSIGSSALDGLTAGNNNTAVGAYALTNATTSADQNTAIGRGAMSGAIVAEDLNDCVAVGGVALSGALDSTASGSVAIGTSALAALTSGAGNIAIGYQSLLTNTDASNNTMVGYQSGYRTTGGGSGNTVLGTSAFSGSHTGSDTDDCVAIGYLALSGALADADGTVAIGKSALAAITSGAGNVAVGYLAGSKLTGANNTILGHSAMWDMVESANSVAIGRNALGGTNDADADASTDNIAIGKDAMGNNWVTVASNYNVAIGTASMAGVMNGALRNTAVGNTALGALTTGDDNVAIGRAAGDAITTGSQCTIIGEEADGAATLANQIAVGYGAVTSVADSVCIGTGITNGTTRTVKFGDAGQSMISQDWDSAGDSTWTRSSDRRRKRNIKDNTLGLEFINKLQTRTFQMKPQNELPKEWVSYSETNRYDTEKVHVGFIAQELKELIDEYGAPDEVASWSEDEDGMQRAGETKLITPLIKAVQELSAEVESLKEQLKA